MCQFVINQSKEDKKMANILEIDLSGRYAKLSEHGDPLERLDKVIDWKIFVPLIEKAFWRERKSPAGRKPYNRLMMFKVLVLQALYNLADGQTEYQIRDRLSFIRFLKLGLTDEVPDEKTIWSYREVLIQGGMLEKLFERFNNYLEKRGYGASLGSIIDASIVEVPKQRNSREVNKQIKNGEVPECIMRNKNIERQKDVHARWTMKNGKTYYGYKDHINADAKYKLIRKFEVTAASTPDIKCFENLLDDKNDFNRVWADSAYYSEQSEKLLDERGLVSRLIHRCQSHYPEGSDQDRENRRRAKVRKRVEHVFGFMENSMHRMFIRSIGIARAKAKICLMNLTYNLCRFEQINRLGVA
jgi:IS5 family transposase